MHEYQLIEMLYTYSVLLYSNHFTKNNQLDQIKDIVKSISCITIMSYLLWLSIAVTINTQKLIMHTLHNKFSTITCIE